VVVQVSVCELTREGEVKGVEAPVLQLITSPLLALEGLASVMCGIFNINNVAE